MQTFLVGGAVRDQLLGLEVVERDWVVVGTTPEALEAAGYRAVGRDFPVFLHPDTHEEYALARTERKTAPGYRGFIVHAAPDVTLEQDLERRDLTINAIAQTPDGEIIDPFNGSADLKNKVLRHVSPAFSEDPVRILRVARFAARFARYGFRIAPDTLDMMQQMVHDGEADALVPERVWKEMETAFGYDSPQTFIQTLRDTDALKVILPEVDALFGVPQPAKYHAEGDSAVHTLMVIEEAAKLAQQKRKSSANEIVFAALCHDLGKALTPQEDWPSHHDHENLGVPAVTAVCDRLRVPNSFRNLAIKSCRYHLHCHRAKELKATSMVKTLSSLDALRKPEQFDDFLLVCEADARGRLPSVTDYPQAALMKHAAQAIAEVDAAAISATADDKSKISELIYNARVQAVKQAFKR